MAAGGEHVQHLIKGYSLEVGDDVAFEAGDLCREEQRGETTEAIRNYFKRHNDDPFIIMQDIGLDNELPIKLSKDFISYFCHALPNPFILIKFELRVQPEQESSNATVGGPGLDKQLQLREFINAKLWGDSDANCKETIPFPNQFNEDTELSCSTSLGWKETPTPIKISSQTLLGKLLEDESTMDLTIVDGNGAEIKCHMIIFTAHSPVFSSMLSSQTGMTEAQTRRVQLEDNSERGVRQLYGKELQPDDFSSEIGLELFQRAHKYGLNRLEGSLLELFMGRGVNWFTPDVSLELYYYTRNLESFPELREHSLLLMASISTGALRSCEVFRKLENQEALELALTLVEYLRKEVPKLKAPIGNAEGKI